MKNEEEPQVSVCFINNIIFKYKYNIIFKKMKINYIYINVDIFLGIKRD